MTNRIFVLFAAFMFALATQASGPAEWSQVVNELNAWCGDGECAGSYHYYYQQFEKQDSRLVLSFQMRPYENTMSPLDTTKKATRWFGEASQLDYVEISSDPVGGVFNASCSFKLDSLEQVLNGRSITVEFSELHVQCTKAAEEAIRELTVN